ncbi:Imm45 family immunity protein [Herbaspirillum huttiense]|uniref:Imm45 family immunity protein n=2 Tax=Herbaspirillum huttiense TaxID=863372 RepID=A0AAJ2LUI4_9BURK|nr:Imm45 family immunity protein [Herbaspirillum huttiense]MDR9835623.1 Imm45 family immunity protein [Herbaspirillum huttiense]
MMEWENLVGLKCEAISNGAIFRAEAEWPYEEKVDFMLVDLPVAERNYAILVATGLKAGLVLVRLPEDASYEHGRGISRQWLVQNWSKWIYPECPVEKVMYLPRYKTQDLE